VLPLELAVNRCCVLSSGVPSDYRLNPALAARLLGVGLVGVALLVFVGTAIVAVLHLPPVLIGLLAGLVLVVVFGGGLALTRASYVVRLGDEDYHVRFIRGAGVTQARWVDVEDAVTADIAGAPCVVLRLKDGRTTSIPVGALAADGDDFVRDVREHLDRGHGMRRL